MASLGEAVRGGAESPDDESIDDSFADSSEEVAAGIVHSKRQVGSEDKNPKSLKRAKSDTEVDASASASTSDSASASADATGGTEEKSSPMAKVVTTKPTVTPNVLNGRGQAMRTEAPWVSAYKNPGRYSHCKKVPWGHGYVTHFVGMNGHDTTFSIPASRVQYVKLGGLGNPPRPDNKDAEGVDTGGGQKEPSDSTDTLTLTVGNLTATTRRINPKLAQEHIDFPVAWQEFCDQMKRYAFENDLAPDNLRACYAQADSDVHEKYSDYPDDQAVLSESELVELVLKKVSGSERSEVVATLRSSGLLQMGKCGPEHDSGARAMILKHTAKESETRMEELIKEKAFALYAKDFKVPVHWDADDTSVMRMYFESRAVFTPRKKPKTPKPLNTMPKDWPEYVREYHAVCGDWGPFERWDREFLGPDGKPLTNAETGNLYKDELAKDPFQEVLKVGDVVSTTFKLRFYWMEGSASNYGLKIRPQWKHIKRFYTNIEDDADAGTGNTLDYYGDAVNASGTVPADASQAPEDAMGDTF